MTTPCKFFSCKVKEEEGRNKDTAEKQHKTGVRFGSSRSGEVHLLSSQRPRMKEISKSQHQPESSPLCSLHQHTHCRDGREMQNPKFSAKCIPSCVFHTEVNIFSTCLLPCILFFFFPLKATGPQNSSSQPKSFQKQTTLTKFWAAQLLLGTINMNSSLLFYPVFQLSRPTVSP